MKTKLSKATKWVKTQSAKLYNRFRKHVNDSGVAAIEAVRHQGHRFSVAYSKFSVQFLVTTVTFGLSWLMLTMAFPLWLAMVVMGTAVAHELGHMYAARQIGYAPRTPFFVPFLFMIWSGTHIPGIEKNPADVMTVAVAGPTAGIAAAGLALCAGIIWAFPAMAWAGFWMLAFQVYAVTFGSDGRRYRRAQKEFATDARDFSIVVGSAETRLAPTPV